MTAAMGLATPQFRPGGGAGFGLLCLWVVTVGPWLPFAVPVLQDAAQTVGPQPWDLISNIEPNATAAPINQVTFVPEVNLRLPYIDFPVFSVYRSDIPVSGRPDFFKLSN